ncbi:hypothetical protein Tco_1569292 [Tanacetum coccineum]
MSATPEHPENAMVHLPKVNIEGAHAVMKNASCSSNTSSRHCGLCSDVMAPGEVLLVQLNFLASTCMFGHQKAEKVRSSTIQKLKYITLQDASYQILWMRFSIVTMDLRSTKFRCIVTIKVAYCSMLLIVLFITRAPSTLISVHFFKAG